MENSDEHDELGAALQPLAEGSESSDDGGTKERSEDRGPTDEELLRSLRDAIRRVEGR
jgi:hypothetical protein